MREIILLSVQYVDHLLVLECVHLAADVHLCFYP